MFIYSFDLINAGYLACARCSSTGAIVLIEPVSTANSGDQPLSAPKTERCSNCSGSGKVRHLVNYIELGVNMPNYFISTNFCSTYFISF